MSDFTTPRITEKRYYSVPPTVLIANGTATGLITVTSTYCFKVGQSVLFIQGSTFFKAKIKRVLSETQFIVIDENESVVTTKKLDMTAFLIGTTVEIKESKRPVIDILEIQRQVYEEEPTVALRSHDVDWLGRSYGPGNPLPTDTREATVLTNLKTLELLGIPLDDYIIADDEIVSLADGTLLKADF